MTWYKKADTGANSYSTTVKVKMYGPKHVDIGASDLVKVNFNIDVEAREWGIKYVGIVLSDTVNVPYIILDDDENEVGGTIAVDLSQVSKEFLAGSNTFTVGDMELWLDDNFNINYDMTTIQVYTY